MFSRYAILLLAVLMCAVPAAGQINPNAPAPDLGPYDQMPQPFEILGISVEGVANENTQTFVQQASGLRVGQTVTLPSDQAFADAIRNIYRLGLFSNVRVVEERRVGNGVFVAIQVKEEPRLADFGFEGVKKGHRKDLREAMPIIKGTPVRPAEIERSVQVIEEFYKEKGYLLADVEVQRQDSTGNTVQLTFVVDRGRKVEVGDIDFTGNEEISDRRLRKRMQTKEDRWWRFWKSSTFNRDKYEQDLRTLVDYYNQKGFFDAQIVDDTVYVRSEGGEPEVVINITVKEGARYHIRNIEWEGNTVYTDEFLTNALGFERGDVYNSQKLESNLYANRQSSDVSSLYLNRGYMRFQVHPTIRVVEGDSLDLHFEVIEGDVYEFGDIRIAGNTKTKEHVIRRELYTVPGQTFSRELIQESIRRLSQLNYFTQESLQQPPGIDINEQQKTVDLTYKLEEASSDQLELSGTWGSFGLVLMLRFNFNNFSAQNLFNREAWSPLPSGDGQQLALAVQTNGSYYQSYSLSFTEPWFRGKPTPVGFGLSYSKIDQGSYLRRLTRSSASESGGLSTISARLFYDQRLKWPDDKFNSSTGIRYQFYRNDSLFQAIPFGVTQFLTLQQSFSRNSSDHPFFPQSGSTALLSVEVAPPLPGFAQYHKWRFRTSWNAPILPKLTLSVGTDYGFVGSLTGERVSFERFIVGGSPFDTQGFYSQFGRDIIYMRGYPVTSIGPRRDGEAVGGTILNKYTSELRWMAIASQQLQAAPYLFMDAANTWNSFRSYNPAELYRSAGVGIRLFLPIIGMLELNYGYNFDPFVPINQTSRDRTGDPGWSFQFSLGQGFNQ